MNLIGFVISAVVIALAGTSLSRIADRLADRTGLGEALMGGIFLGASTSISGSVLSMISAYDGLTDLAIGNALGGIAAQTFFLVLADFYYTKSNLEHAAVSSTNIMLSALLVGLLTIPIIAQALPEISLFGIHPTTFVLLIGYTAGLKYISAEKRDPMWHPTKTKETVEDAPEEPIGGKNLVRLWVHFAVLTVLLIVSGITLKITGVNLAKEWGLTHLVLGTILTAIITSLPELVTTFAAVKRGALTLAVSGIVGGNSFDVLFLAFSDITYREGSLYHTMSTGHLSYIALTITMISVLIMGLLRREKFGIGNIGAESVIIGVLYIFSVLLVFN